MPDMKRNIDLIRQILIEVEKQPFKQGWFNLGLEGYPPEVVSFHACLLHEGGLIIAIERTPHGSDFPHWFPVRLTWRGCEFLAAVRDELRWNRVKSVAGHERFPFRVIEKIALELAEAEALSRVTTIDEA